MCRHGGAPRSTKSTRSFPTSPDSLSRLIPKASPARRATVARPPTPPTRSPVPSIPTAAWCSTAPSFTTTTSTGMTRRLIARAAYDIFHPLDGKFAPNVIVQIKEGPIDFQAQEPVSPLFGGLTRTNAALELQVTQEYTGQQRHLVYLAPMWKGVLDFDMRVEGKSTPVKNIVSGQSFGRPLGGMVGVAGIGQDHWLNSPLAIANLYAFGRLAWDPSLTAEEIAQEWTRQTISDDPVVVKTVTTMLMQSWPAYVNYTGPLGMQTLTDIIGSHYGPNIESSERNGWGQWHKVDHDGVGF